MITPPVLELPNHPRGILGAFHGSHLVAVVILVEGMGYIMEPGHLEGHTNVRHAELPFPGKGLIAVCTWLVRPWHSWKKSREWFLSI